MNKLFGQDLFLVCFSAIILTFFLSISTVSADPIAYEVIQSVSYRAGPGNSYPVLGTLPLGTRINVFGNERGWLKMKLNESQFVYSYQKFFRQIGGGTPSVQQRSTSTIYVCVYNNSGMTREYSISWADSCSQTQWVKLGHGQFRTHGCPSNSRRTPVLIEPGDGGYLKTRFLNIAARSQCTSSNSVTMIRDMNAQTGKP